MDRSRQATIAEPIRLAGLGLHTGVLQAVTLRPAPAASGIVFRRRGAAETVPAALEAVTGTAGRITLGGRGPDAGGGVSTVEHLLSAAWAAGVDNLEVELEGGEVPGMDGSALPFFRALREAGIRPLDAPRAMLRVEAPVWVGQPGEPGGAGGVGGAGGAAAGGAFAVALPAPRFAVDCVVRLDGPGLGDQAASYDPARDRYEEVIAPARTWGYARDVEELRRRGLALGSSLENTLAIGAGGYLNAPRFPNEAARHKVLDLLGDLALLGADVLGHVVAVRAGHALHVALARALRAQGG